MIPGQVLSMRRLLYRIMLSLQVPSRTFCLALRCDCMCLKYCIVLYNPVPSVTDQAFMLFTSPGSNAVMKPFSYHIYWNRSDAF